MYTGAMPSLASAPYVRQAKSITFPISYRSVNGATTVARDPAHKGELRGEFRSSERPPVTMRRSPGTQYGGCIGTSGPGLFRVLAGRFQRRRAAPRTGVVRRDRRRGGAHPVRTDRIREDL